MQLQDLVGRIRKTLGEVEPNGYGSQQDGDGSWDNSQIIGYLNEALGELALIWRKEETATTTMVTGQSSYALPTDCLEDGLRKVVYSNGQTTFPCTYTDFDDYVRYSNESSGYITNNHVYTVWSGQIFIYPTSNNNTDTLTSYYYRLPAKLSSATDTPEIPERFHQALIFYALRECQNAVEEVNLEGDVGGKWEQEKQRFRAEMARRQRDNVRVRSKRR